MNFFKVIKSMGPGLLWAGAAIGVSHLVQSTRAGAGYGFELVWLVIIVNLVKYPFFEFAPRYAAATGENLLQGYARLGKWAIPLYFVMTWLTMFTLQAAVTVVTASLFSSIFGGLDTVGWTYVLMGVGAVIVWMGNYTLLDKFIKVIIVLLTVSAIVTVGLAASKGYMPQPEFAKGFSWASVADIGFLVALAGWMPTAIDVSVWHSVWTIAKRDSSGEELNVKSALFDFNVGYVGTAILSLCFLALGALVMYGTGNSFSAKGTVFAGQLIELFTSSLGTWAYPVIAVAALATMVSTTITVLDAFPRVLSEASFLAIPSLNTPSKQRKTSSFWLLLLVVGSCLIVLFFMSSMKLFIDVATILSFLTAPILGWMNYKVVTGSNVPEAHKPAVWLQKFSLFGVVVLFAFSLFYIWMLIS